MRECFRPGRREVGYSQLEEDEMTQYRSNLTKKDWVKRRGWERAEFKMYINNRQQNNDYQNNFPPSSIS